MVGDREGRRFEDEREGASIGEWPGEDIAVGEVMNDVVIGIEEGELFATVAESAAVEVIAEDVGRDGDAGRESRVAGIEGSPVFNDNDASAGREDGVVGKVEGDAEGEANAGKVNGLGGDIFELKAAVAGSPGW